MPMTKHIQALREIKVIINEYTFFEFDKSVFDLKTRAIDDIIHDANAIVKHMTEDLDALKEKVDIVLNRFF